MSHGTTVRFSQAGDNPEKYALPRCVIQAVADLAHPGRMGFAALRLPSRAGHLPAIERKTSDRFVVGADVEPVIHVAHLDVHILPRLHSFQLDRRVVEGTVYLVGVDPGDD